LATVIFYQKPGCGTNARQKRMLEAAGHIVYASDLLTEPWTIERLRHFFGSTPVVSWFNPAAPRVKSGEVDPKKFDEANALALMIEEPLLIRRPLVEVGDQRCAGFDREPVISLLGEHQGEIPQACTRQDTSTPCPDPNLSPKNSAP
jgi:nitrogenase-associated protein